MKRWATARIFVFRRGLPGSAAGGCNKGAALAVLSQHLGLTMQDCMAFGDAMNDREMLGSVGRGDYGQCDAAAES
jgi:phosphoserine phosphatase